MKKLISILLLMMLVFTTAIALGEANTPADDEGILIEAPETEATLTATTETAEEDNLLGQGLLVTVIGLAGVFLVLILFFLTIKMMNKMLP